MRPRVQNRMKATLYRWRGPLHSLLSVIGGGVALVLVFLLALVYSAFCLTMRPVSEPMAAAPVEPVIPLRQCRIVPTGPEISVLSAMMVPYVSALESVELVMQEMEGLVETEPPHDVDFPHLEMELLGDFDGGMPASVLRGKFYDLTRNKGGAPTGLVNGKEFQSVVNKCLYSWDWSIMGRFWRLPATLYSSCFLYPLADDAQLPEMFSWPPGSLPSSWMAAYYGRVESPVSGTIRFVGTGGTYLGVCFNFQPVLESGSCLVSARGDENPHSLAAGAAIKVKEGEVYSVCIIVAGSGDVADFGLLWEYAPEKNEAGKEGKSADTRYYLFRTNLCTPDDNDVVEVQCQGKKWPIFDPDSPIWMVVP